MRFKPSRPYSCKLRASKRN